MMGKNKAFAVILTIVSCMILFVLGFSDVSKAEVKILGTGVVIYSVSFKGGQNYCPIGGHFNWLFATLF